MEFAFKKVMGAQWTGQGSENVFTALDELVKVTGNTWDVVSNDGETLVLSETSPSGLTATWTMHNGQVLIVDASRGSVEILDVEEFSLRYNRYEVLAEQVLTDGLANEAWMNAMAEQILVKGLNSPAWITALKNRLGIG